ncbi:hypothetical protein [Xanthomonas translucens]|uniref:hypothetical protein n=1 Tax=Xanthomonas campestris pv. translucens TaxID=343 RepID=UPI0012D8980F|nr:hypothetical protein [Xanthomonas translucens]WLA03758.1 hypothetical protein MO329_13945 [Xanthomonas translucens]
MIKKWLRAAGVRCPQILSNLYLFCNLIFINEWYALQQYGGCGGSSQRVFGRIESSWGGVSTVAKVTLLQASYACFCALSHKKAYAGAVGVINRAHAILVRLHYLRDISIFK